MSYTEFRPDEFSTRIRLERYGASPTESWEEHSRRIAHHVALYSEKSELVEKIESLYYDEIVSNRFCPGGRIQYGSQRPKGQLLNCFRAGTPVHTTEGIFPIESLIGKSSVTILDRDGTERQATFRAFGRQQLLRVTFANGDVVYATPNHNWFTSSRHPRGLVTTKTHSLEGRRVPLVCKLRPITNKEEWLTGVQHGLTFGDGSLYMGGKYSALRQFGDSKHLVEDYFPSWSTYEQIDCLQVGKLPPEWKTIPNVDDVSVSYLIGFLAGVIASDGHVDKRGHVMFHNRDFETTRAVQKISAYVGIPCYSIKLTRTINPFNNEPSTLYKLAFAKRGFYVEEKPNHELILKNLHREHLANCCPPSTKTISVKVLEVKDTEIEEEVYCAIEPETHSFTIASGIATGNCFVLGNSFLDSREGWGKVTSDSIIVTGTGGGIGINFSPVRPRGADIRGHSGKATGAVSLMEIINAVANVIKAGGGRRAALMFALNHDHPDTLEFMNKKLDLSQLNNANVSTVFMSESPGDFLAKVERDELHQFVWQGNVVGEVPARELWDIILKNAVNCGEPGILNGWLANKENNIHYHADLISTNPCGEIWLEKYGCCDLGALVLPRFVKDGEIDKKLLARSVYAAVRFLDGVLDANNYPLKEIEENCKTVRRIGLGVMGLHDALILCGKKYSSDEGVEWVDKLMSFIKNKAYEASIELAIEKGQFPALDRQKFVESGFCKRSLKTSIKEKILLHGIRNCALLTIAPTGCQVGDTLIITNDGILELVEMVDPCGAQWQPHHVEVAQDRPGVTAISDKGFINGVADTTILSLHSGLELEATHNHRYRVLSEENDGEYIWKRADQIKVGDALAVKIGGYTKETEPALITEVDAHFNNQNIILPESMSPAFAEILGLYFADGSNHHKGIRIHLNAVETEFNSSICEKIELVLGVYPIRIISRGCESLYINSTRILKYLEVNGLLKQKAKDVEIPKAIRTASKDSLIAFLFGYWLGDGSTSSSRVWYVDTISKKFAHQFTVCARAVGLNARISLDDTRSSSIGDAPIYRIQNVAFGSSTFDEKKLRYRTVRERELFELGKKFNVFYDVVESVGAGKASTYDISVVETEQYIANSIVSHNTTAIESMVTSGIEPIYSFAYRRRFRSGNGDEFDTQVVEHPLFASLKHDPTRAPLFENALELSVESHMRMQAICQKHIDNAVSKTINVPREYEGHDLDITLRKYVDQLKGVTVYRDGSRGESPIQPLTFEEAMQLQSCPSGVCDLG